MTYGMRLVLVSLMILLLVGCIDQTLRHDSDGRADPKVLKDIAYDVDASYGYTVYIEEDEEYIPYLVLTSDYSGHCLLLRKYLLDDPRIFNKKDQIPSYYECSDIDLFLNDEFKNKFSDEIKKKIIKSDIAITDKASLGSSECGNIHIDRHVFLLSANEIGVDLYGAMLNEGYPLEYFESVDSRIAYYSNGVPGYWWLRTPDTMYSYVVYCVWDDGSVGYSGINNHEGGYKYGVRPALCFAIDTPIERHDDINNNVIYVIQ